MQQTDMHELRKDPLLGRWVAVLNDSKPPAAYSSLPDKETEKDCILCSGREGELPAEIMSIPNLNFGQNSDGDSGRGHEGASNKWWTRVVPSLSPVFRIEGDLGRKGEGMYDKMNSVGATEIIIESPEHSMRPEDMGLDQMARVLSTYRERIADLERDPRLRYTLIYKNSGLSSGAVYSHPISHLVSTPVIPKRVKEELDGAKQYFAYKERCIFCDFISEELRFGARIILETRHFVAFCPYASKFPFEFWILPKRHSCAFQDINAEEIQDMALIFSAALKKLRAVFDGVSFNYFIHSAPNRIPRKNHWHTLGEDFHWHLEVMPRLLRTSGFEWGSGFYISPTSPEEAAKYLREA